MQLKEALLFYEILNLLIQLDHPRDVIAHVNISDLDLSQRVLFLNQFLKPVLCHVSREIAHNQPKVAWGDVYLVDGNRHLHEGASHEDRMDEKNHDTRHVKVHEQVREQLILVSEKELAECI